MKIFQGMRIIVTYQHTNEIKLFCRFIWLCLYNYRFYNNGFTKFIHRLQNILWRRFNVPKYLPMVIQLSEHPHFGERNNWPNTRLLDSVSTKLLSQWWPKCPLQNNQRTYLLFEFDFKVLHNKNITYLEWGSRELKVIF